eukprot:g1397.t1
MAERFVIGAQVAVGDRGLAYAESVAIPLLVSKIGTISIPDVKFDKDGIKFKVSSISCSDVAVGKCAVTAPGSVLRLAASDIDIKCKADWKYSAPLGISGSGTVDIKVGGSKTSLNLDLNVSHPAGLTPETRGPTSVLVEACEDSVDITDLHFSGGVSSAILNLFKSLITSTIESEIKGTICATLKTEVAKAVNPELAKAPISYLQCATADNALACGLSLSLGPFGEPPFAVPAPVAPSAAALAAHEVVATLTPAPLDGLLFAAYDMGAIDVILTQDMLPKGVPLTLNTSAFQDIAPGLASAYPNLAMQLELNATARPQVTFGAGLVNVSLSAELRFLVDDPNFDIREAFALAAPVELSVGNIGLSPAGAAAGGASNTSYDLTAEVHSLTCPLTLARTAVGNVSMADLNGLVSFALSGVATPALNKILNKGVAIPSSFDKGEIALQNTAPATQCQQHQQYQQPHGSRPCSFERICAKSSPATAGALGAGAAEKDIRQYGAVAGSRKHGLGNSHALYAALMNATDGDTVVVPDVATAGGEFFLVGLPADVAGLVGVTLRIDGILRADFDLVNWPRDTSSKQAYLNILQFSNCTRLTITSSTADSLAGSARQPQAGGLIDGQGREWWNGAVFGSLGTTRPKMLRVVQSEHVLVEKLELLNSPRFTLQLDDVLHAEVRYVRVHVDRNVIRPLKEVLSKRRRMMTRRRKSSSKGGGEAAAGAAAAAAAGGGTGGRRQLLFNNLQPEDLNTDGIDPSGKDIWIHDCHVQNDDDSIAVKPCNQGCVKCDCAEDIMIENTVLTGFGASIGSVPPHTNHNCVRNVTFRNITMPGTGKGVYVKSNPSCAADGSKTSEITDITYEDITITRPKWWAVWIGPQQQQEPGQSLGDKCSLFYPFYPGQGCPTQGCVTFTNITLRRVTIDSPVLSPGVILGNSTNPMKGLVFEDVVVTGTGAGDVPYEATYECEHVSGGIARGTTSPVPPCFTKE